MPNGIAIAQSGVPIETAADYKKVYDSRDKFLEIAFQGTIDISLPYIAPTSSTTAIYNSPITVILHGLNFFPLFEANIKLISGTPGLNQTGEPASSEYDPSIVNSSKNELIFFTRYLPTEGQVAVTFRVKYRVYNLDIEKPYVSKAATFTGSSTLGSSIGAKFLDGSTYNSVGDKSMLGFSLDTTKKTIAVHRVIQQTINSYGYSYIYHYAGYPPSYLLCKLPTQIFLSYYSGFNIPWRNEYYSTSIYNQLAFTIANGDYIGLHGIQSSIIGDFCFVILKDQLSISE